MRALFLFGFGAVVGSIFDGFHTYSGVTEYTNPVFMKAAWWVPPVFGAATFAIGATHVKADALLGRRRVPSWLEAGLGMLVFGALYYLSGFWQASNAAKLALLAAGAAASWALLDRRPHAIGLMLFTAAVGPLVEIAMVSTGLFRHVGSDFAGIPLWLPGLYAVASVSVGNLGRRVLAEPSSLTAASRP